MHALARSLTRHTGPVEHQLNKALLSYPTNSPKLKCRPSNLNVINWRRQQQATYYMDASQQTTKTLRTLLTQIQQKNNCLGKQPNINLLSGSMSHLLESLKPGLEDDAKSQHQYFSLLRMHLSRLTSTDIDLLKQSLISSKFHCYVTESFIDDETYLEYGFSNGPPHCRNRTLLQTTDLYRLLDGLKQTAVLRENANTESAVLTPEQAQEARDVLAQSAQFWMQSDNSLEVLQDTTCRLAMALDINTMPQTTIVAELSSSSSTVGWNNHQLVLDPKTALQLSSGKNDLLYARVLRDVLELLISLKLTGTALQPNQLASSERSKVLNLVERITEQCKPSSGNVMLHQQARAVMKHSAQFGQIQIKPGAGGSLGHAWIIPKLSLVPNKLIPPHEIGKRYMHTGLNLAPDDTTIRAWSPKFLTEKENEQIHPADSAWHLTVPVNMLRLQEAAKETVQEWQENKVPYRFIGTEPGMSATGCRMTVWHAIEQGMEPDALALFKHYNRGLPEPDSPTELWIRMHGLMEWIEELART